MSALYAHGPIHSRRSHLREVVVLGGVGREMEAGEKLGVSALQQLVEDVERPLSLRVRDDARLLQQVVVDVASNRGTLGGEGRERGREGRREGEREKGGH